MHEEGYKQVEVAMTTGVCSLDRFIEKQLESSRMPLLHPSIVRQPIQQADTQDHDEQPNGHDYEQGKTEPS